MIGAVEVSTGVFLTRHNELGQVCGFVLLGAMTLVAFLLALRRLLRTVRQPETADYDDGPPPSRVKNTDDGGPSFPSET